MKWEVIQDKIDILTLMDFFGGFHDSCLKELVMLTDSYIEEDLSMSMSMEMDTCVRVLFQRQEKPSAIELVFKGVTGLILIPRPANYDSVIRGATLTMQDGFFYWADTEEWQLEQRFDGTSSWISAKEIQWREISEWMGEKRRYGLIDAD
ncbi:hypothetical protein [Planococcus sp. YIM B11945]|uniref:hypothetical protein n=1 Tax=Planococcus sp. YIM B11945 TaxID=3435410 RepID=UPI003D7CBB9A